MIPVLPEAFERTPFAVDLPDRLPAPGGALRLDGLPGSSPGLTIAWLAARLPQRLFTVIATTPADAERWLADLLSLTELPVALYPQREAL
ncbi:MAG: hypothetical protein ACRENB_03170, partial [Gemmatimonadales bacterium]